MILVEIYYESQNMSLIIKTCQSTITNFIFKPMEIYRTEYHSILISMLSNFLYNNLPEHAAIELLTGRPTVPSSMTTVTLKM